MHLVIYLSLCLFLIHSALLSASKTLIIISVFMLLVAVCFFILCIVQRYLVRAELYQDGGEVTLLVEKKGILPVTKMNAVIHFIYDQSGEVSIQRTSFSVPPGRTLVVFDCVFPFVGSGTFRMGKCSVSDPLSFFGIPVRKYKKIRTEVDVQPAFEEAEIYVQSNRLTGTISDRAITVNHIGDDPSETFQVREYHPGDMISRTHWKLTAKRDIMMTRDFAKESDSQYLFVLSFTKNSQECFSKVLTNYYALAARLLSMDTNHMVLWPDDEGSVWDGFVNTEDDLENIILMICHSFDAGRFDKNTLAAREALSPVSGDVVLEEFLSRTPGSSFIKQFIITDEPLDILQGRWAEDEED